MTEPHPRTFWTADRSGLVEEGDPRAAFLAYAEMDPIPAEHVALLPVAQPEPKAPAQHATKAAPVKRATRKAG